MVKKMNHIKKIIFVAFLVIIGILATSEKEEKLDVTSSETMNQNDEYKEILITLLYPTIEKAVDDFYEPYLTNNPMVMPYDIKIKNVQSVRNDYSSFIKYIVTVEVPPFLGPHRYIGEEKIVLNIDVSGNVSVRKYNHLKSEDIFPLDKPLFKKPLPRK